MKRLVAYVERVASSAGWRWSVDELAAGESRAAVWSGNCHDASVAVRDAEIIAAQRGFGLTWHGFVAHGFEIEAAPTVHVTVAKAEGAGGA